MAEPVQADGVPERLHDRSLADHLAEGLGAESPIDRGVGGGSLAQGHPWSLGPDRAP